jgi:uncharacterized protein
MLQRANTLDLDSLDLRPGGGARLDAMVPVDPVDLGGQRYAVEAGGVDARVDLSRTVSGYAFRLRFEASLEGPCMRCLSDARPAIAVDAREIEQPGESEELHSPYVDQGQLALARWARDALVLAMPAQIVCGPGCRGLCPECGVNLNEVDPEQHRHEAAGDPRWAKLRDLTLS